VSSKHGQEIFIRTHPARNQLTRALGLQTPLPDYFIESVSLDLQNDDLLLLCSDGVWEPITEEDMVKVLQKNADDLPQVAYEILNLVLERGAPDNATILLVHLRETNLRTLMI